MPVTRYFKEDDKLREASNRFEVLKGSSSGYIDPQEDEEKEEEAEREPNRFETLQDEIRQRAEDEALDYAGEKIEEKLAQRAAGKAAQQAGQQVATRAAGQAAAGAASEAAAAGAAAGAAEAGVAAAAVATSEFWVPALLILAAIVVVVLIIVVFIVSFSGNGDVQASGTSTIQSFDQAAPTDITALRTLIAGGVDSVERAKAILAETTKLRALLSGNAAAIATLDKIDAAANAIIANPDNADKIKGEAKKISDGFTELSRLIATGLPAGGTFWRSFYDEAVALGAVPIPGRPGKVGTPVSQLYGEFSLTSSTCSGGLSRVIARTQKNSGKYSEDEIILPKNACIDLFRALTNPSSRWAARIIAGQPFTTEAKTQITGERFGDLVDANKIPKGALVYILSKNGQQGHVFMFNGIENRRILRSGSGGPYWKNDSLPLTAYDDYEVIVVALDTGIWAR